MIKLKGIENLSKNNSTYIPEETDDQSTIKKKFIKKYPDALDSIETFGQNQNEFNRQVSECFDELIEHCKNLENTLTAEIAARKKDTASSSALISSLKSSLKSSIKKDIDAVRLRSTLNSNQIEKIDGALVRYSERTEDYILHIAPGARLKDCPKGCHEANIDSLVNMPERLGSIKKASGEEREKKLHDLEKVCMKAVSRELSYFNAYEEVGIDFYGSEKYAEIIYKNLCRNSIYKIEYGHDSENSGRYFVYCGETVAVPEKAILKSGMIFITGHNPFEGLNEEFINDLKFLNDCGIHSYTAMNLEAFNALKNAGFRCITAASAEELASGKVISAVEAGIENAIPGGAEKYSALINKLDNSGIKFARTSDEILEFITKYRLDDNDFNANCIKSLEKTASAAIIKNYFGDTVITSSDLSQDAAMQYDLITGFDYISHFDYKDRKSLYKKAKSMLKLGGLFLFSGRDPVTEIKMRAIEGWEKYPIYEAMWTSKQLITELEENGFQIRFLIPTGTGLYDVLPCKYKDIPSLYIIGAVPVK